MVCRNIFSAIFLTVAASFFGAPIATAREVAVQGRTYESIVGELPLPVREALKDPCGTRFSRPNYRGKRSNQDGENFFDRMMREVRRAAEILEEIKGTDPDVGACTGLGPLKSFPAIPSEAIVHSKPQFIRHVYQIGINLVAHLRVMSLDRQMIVNNTVVNQVIRCGSESESLGGLFNQLTNVFDDILCATMNSASDAQLINFARTYEELMNIPILRFVNICSSMEVRDCLVIHELEGFLGSYMYPVLKKALGQDSVNLLPGGSHRGISYLTY